jgi:hypothetical protein
VPVTKDGLAVKAMLFKLGHNSPKKRKSRLSGGWRVSTRILLSRAGSAASPNLGLRLCVRHGDVHHIQSLAGAVAKRPPPLIFDPCSCHPWGVPEEFTGQGL